MARRILEGLVVACIIGLITTVLILKESVAVLQTSMAFQERQITEMRADVKDLQRDHHRSR